MMKEIDIEELKQLQCDILYKIHTFCNENNINYSLAYGTLLGAVRHKGYIPWDDDIDIMMLRSDYEKFIYNFQGAYPELSICAPELNLDYYAPYCNVWDNRTKLKENVTDNFEYDNHRGFDIGVKIDVFPIDAVPSGPKNHLVIRTKILNAFRWASARPYSFYLKAKNNISYKIKFCFLRFVSMFLGYKKIQRMIINLGHNCESKFKDSGRVDMVVFDYKIRDFSRKGFDCCIEIPFEKFIFKAISNYDEFLSSSYGDYMKLPPKEQQVAHHGFKAYWKD